jgi:hypothetical protein
MSISRKILVVLFAVFIIIQVFRPEKNQSAAETPNDIFAHYKADANTKQLIQTACYDCHSNNTVYPWYAEIQPVAWWLADHVNEGKSELNFSEFATYTPKKGDHKLEEVVEMIKEREMPLKSYTLIHGDANLSDAQREELSKWAEQVRAQIQPNIIKLLTDLRTLADIRSQTSDFRPQISDLRFQTSYNYKQKTPLFLQNRGFLLKTIILIKLQKQPLLLQEPYVSGDFQFLT